MVDNYFELNDHRLAVSKLFRKVMAGHGMTKKQLVHDCLRHEFRPAYRKQYQWLGVGGRLFCDELWKILGFYQYENVPVFQYGVHWVEGLQDGFEVGNEIDEEAVESYFQQIVSEAIVPIASSILTPVDAVQYAASHLYILGRSRLKAYECLKKWHQYYGLAYETPDWAHVETDLPLELMNKFAAKNRV